MKVLTIKEPFATLISKGIKKIETRSWKTKYRGELYIQASISKLSKNLQNRKELLELIKDLEFNYGYIICKCNLVDCIYMTKEYIEEIKKNKNEYICGMYEVGRYAWVLDNVEILLEPIRVKGQLGIWNYKKTL